MDRTIQYVAGSLMEAVYMKQIYRQIFLEIIIQQMYSLVSILIIWYAYIEFLDIVGEIDDCETVVVAITSFRPVLWYCCVSWRNDGCRGK